MAPSAISTQIEETLEHVSLKGQSNNTEVNLINRPLALTGVLDQYESFELTPVIGKEFPTANLVDWLHAPNADQLIRDLAVTSTYMIGCPAQLGYRD